MKKFSISQPSANRVCKRCGNRNPGELVPQGREWICVRCANPFWLRTKHPRVYDAVYGKRNPNPATSSKVV